MIAKVALGIPFSSPYDYRLSEIISSDIVPGTRVLVSVGTRVMVGCIVALQESSTFDTLKDVIDVVDKQPLYSRGMLKLTRWISDYYLVSWGEVLDAAIPGGLKPKIVKVAEVNPVANHDLSAEERDWLATIQGKTDNAIRGDECYHQFKTRLSRWKKMKLVSYRYAVTLPKVSSDDDYVISINHEIAAHTKTRKGSKADAILERLNSQASVRLSTLKSQIPGANPALRQLIQKKAVKKRYSPPDKASKNEAINTTAFISLNEEQAIAFSEIEASIKRDRFKTFLLFGVTGSGKTEVYLHAVKETLTRQRSVLILIPEISLTHQVVSRFKTRFGDRIAVLHSGMAEKDRCAEWWKIKNGRCDIVIGARSAIFAPLENIGLVVVDEEHDSSYKQQESPFYNARDIAVKLGQDHNAVVILGSATPSIESFNNAYGGKYHLSRLPTRANKKPLPPISVIDLKSESRQAGVFYLSKALVRQLKDNLSDGKQALVFLNRRGYAAFLSCKACDLPVLCANCSIALTWHRKEKRLVCHHCGFRQPYPNQCPACGEKSLRLDGIGTERVERDLRLIFPSARFLRMDRDTVKRKGVLEKNIDLINNHEVDFIIGTQLISKGHDFKQVGLVCVILADIGLNIPDFRSSERSFQLLSQVSGRAGRDEEGRGVVLAQTYNPNHFAVVSAVSNDVEGFIERELELRHTLENPPIKKMILLKISDPVLNNVELTAREMGALLTSKSTELGCQVLGPIESPIAKINRRFYWQILLKADDTRFVKRFLRFLFWEQNEWRPKGSTRVSIDVDPYFLL